MKSILTLCAVVSVCLLQGCWVSSVEPLAENEYKETIMVPELEGIWEAPPGLCEEDEHDTHPCILSIKRHVQESSYGGAPETRYYDIEQQTMVKVGFRANVVQLGPYRFLDTIPTDKAIEDRLSTAYFYHLFFAHTFWKMELEGDTLRLAQPDNDFLYDMWHSEPPKGLAVHFSCGYKSDCYMFTAKPPELQKFYLKYAGDPKAFPAKHYFEFKRKSESAGGAAR